ncbi:hypothetical protein BsIDN1_15860 [Bacillus safensis]|uniref:Uncharacterized protein n=1 Tax=Bacillus safensis TaxID=561879 RepID=A0A5S9M591_BACIA|nr:hypothetical protein BsIDN1_15860 [Bacillus safensis]
MDNDRNVLIILALLGHSFFLYEYTQGRYMTGDGDGISQMPHLKSCFTMNTSKGTSFIPINSV